MKRCTLPHTPVLFVVLLLYRWNNSGGSLDDLCPVACDIAVVVVPTIRPPSAVRAAISSHNASSSSPRPATIAAEFAATTRRPLNTDDDGAVSNVCRRPFSVVGSRIVQPLVYCTLEIGFLVRKTHILGLLSSIIFAL